MANGNIQAVTEHALVKTFTPLIVAGLMGIVGWLFATVMDVEKIARDNKLHIKHLHIAEENFDKFKKQENEKEARKLIEVKRKERLQKEKAAKGSAKKKLKTLSSNF